MSPSVPALAIIGMGKMGRAVEERARERGWTITATLTDRDAPTYNADTFETNVPGLFVAGGALAGVDTGTVFIENGRFHGEKIIDVIASRFGE